MIRASTTEEGGRKAALILSEISMDKVYQAFVSSTFSDLEGERKKVSDTLSKAGFIPAGMELFPATSLQQLEFIKRVIDRCDYYIVIVGARYGSLDGEKSFTEREYEYAVSKKIPVLAFIHKNPGKIAAEKRPRLIHNKLLDWKRSVHG